MKREKIAFALLFLALLAAPVSAACGSYGELPGPSGCCLGLQPDSSGKCNQLSNVCDLVPETWVQPLPTSTLSNPQSPGGATGQLETGGGVGPGGTALGSSSPVYQVGWFSDWKIAGIIGVAIAVAVISLAAMIGRFLNIPELKAFVDTELSQCIVSVLLIVMIVSMLVFLDSISRVIVGEGTGDLRCGNFGGEPCYVTIAKSYLDDLYNVGTQYSRDRLSASATYQGIATTGFNVVSNYATWLFAGINTRPLAGLSVEAERASALFETMSKLLASIYAQRYFLDVIAYAVAPVMLLLGIMLRTFFFTRKLGGLLLAIALALFIVYPMTYVLSAYTLQVDLYADRGVAVSSSCPKECTVTPPAAFYIDYDAPSASGRIVAFQSPEDLGKAGITKDNWDSGGPGGEYSGLVACEDLSTYLSGSAPAPVASCTSCPAHCRETPFPSQFPDCQIAACSSPLCNPGCKIMRERTDCALECSASSCPLSCRTALPVENKCYSDPAIPGDFVSADLSAAGDCTGCNGCPNWCKIRQKDANGNLELLYKDDPACNIAECKAPSCPDKCVYVTEVGGSFDCESQCGSCPKPCRVKPGQGMTASEFAAYDVEGLVPGFCSSPQYQSACNSCPSVCKVELPSDPSALGCAPYPTNPPSYTECNYCPEYCRFNDFSFIKTDAPLHSATPMTAPFGGQPTACAASSVKCASPSQCAAGCKLPPPAPPQICLPSELSPPDLRYCRGCLEQCRTVTPSTDPQCNTPFMQNACSSTNCGTQCRSDASPPVCQPYLGYGTNPTTGWVDPALESCYPLPGTNPSSCEGLMQGACFPYLGCAWGLPTHCYGSDPVCTSSSVKYSQGACNANAASGCMWKQRGDATIPISIRDGPAIYKQRTACAQCPENCRTGDGSSCGLTASKNTYRGDANAIFDCSASSCELSCQSAPPQSGAGGEVCNRYSPQDTPCTGCNALCRRNAGDSNPSSSSPSYCTSPQQQTACQPYQSGTGCTQDCRLADAPDRACEGCFACPTDCLYAPAVRTDCADLCTSGVSSGALDYPDQASGKLLPGGAQSETDVRNVGVFMLPALVLPLFNIVITLAFIRVFSPTLGGDIEIPGLNRII